VSDEARGDQWRVRSVPAAYLKELFVIFKEERVGGRARVTIDEERDKVEQKSSRGDK